MLKISFTIVMLLFVSGCGEDSGASSSQTVPGSKPDAPTNATKSAGANAPKDAPADSQAVSNTLCLDDCSETKNELLAWKTVQYFKAPTTTCKLADSWMFLSRQNDSVSVLFRANYSSAGLWQLYLRKINQDADGNWVAEKTAANIFPECQGNQKGVEGVQITGIEQVGRKAFVVPAGELGDRVTTIRIKASCASGIKLSEKTIDLASNQPVSSPVAPIANGIQFVTELGPTDLHISVTGKAFDNAGNEISVNLGTLARKVSRILGQDTSGGTYFQLPTEYSLRADVNSSNADRCDIESPRFDKWYCIVQSNIQYLPLGGSPVRLTGTPSQGGASGYLVHPTEGLVWADSDTVLRWVEGEFYTSSDSHFSLDGAQKLTRMGNGIFQFAGGGSSLEVYRTNLRAGVNTIVSSLRNQNMWFSGWYGDRVVAHSLASQSYPVQTGVIMISAPVGDE